MCLDSTVGNAVAHDFHSTNEYANAQLSDGRSPPPRRALRLTGCRFVVAYWSSSHAKMSGATIVASDSTMNFGVSMPSLPHVIFSFGTAPE